MDRTDYQILNILQKDCRTTLKHIGDQVGLTAPAVSERVRRMEEKGVIRGFRIDVERERLDCSMTGFIFVAVEPEKYNTFCEFCEKSSAIMQHLLSCLYGTGAVCFPSEKLHCPFFICSAKSERNPQILRQRNLQAPEQRLFY